MSDLRKKLLNAVTEYDRQQSTKSGYNHYALGHYCAAVTKVVRYVEEHGYPVRLSILNCFCGRLLDRVLKAVGEKRHTKDEAYVGGFEKLPSLPTEEE